MFHRKHMIKLTPPNLAFLVATRGMAAAGIALLAAGKIPQPVRRVLGIGLLTIGAATTVPLARSILRA